MTQQNQDERVLDALARAARDAEPPQPSVATRDALIAQAMREGERRIERDLAQARMPARPTWQLLVGGLALAAAALLVIRFAWPQMPTAAPRGRAEVVSLATGDRVTRTPSSEVVFARVTEESRVIEVLAGEALFDVVPLHEGASFVVETDELEVSVRGTVFTVSRTGETSLVHVFEGRVDVREGDGHTQVSAGQRYASGQGLVNASTAVALQREGEAASARRAAATEPETPATERQPPATEPEAPATEPEPPATEPEPPATERAATVELTALMAARDFEGALAQARNVLRGHPTDVHARLGEAQALQGLRRFDAAATAYDGLARTGPASVRAEAAFRAATLRYQDLHDARGSLASLDAVDLGASLYAERALGLRSRAQAASGDAEGARQTAARYLATFPEGGMQEAMRALAR